MPGNDATGRQRTLFQQNRISPHSDGGYAINALDPSGLYFNPDA